MPSPISRFTPLPTVLAELGARVREHRLNANISQADLAAKVGVSRSAVVRLEQTGDSTMETLARVMRGLGTLENLDALFPALPPNPQVIAQLQGHARKRARRPVKAKETR